MLSLLLSIEGERLLGIKFVSLFLSESFHNVLFGLICGSTYEGRVRKIHKYGSA